MSRIIQQIATVQFQVDNRKVTASMEALQEKAKSLNQDIEKMDQNIKALGDVPDDHPGLLDYQKQLRFFIQHFFFSIFRLSGFTRLVNLELIKNKVSPACT